MFVICSFDSEQRFVLLKLHLLADLEKDCQAKNENFSFALLKRWNVTSFQELSRELS